MNKQLRNKIWVTLLVLIIMQLGQQIMIPQLKPEVLDNLLHSNPLLQVFTTVTGAQYTKPTLFSIGIGPYMITLILFSALQALGLFKKWTQEALGLIQRILTLLFAILQATQMVSFFKNSVSSSGNVNPNVTLISAGMVAGAMLLIWLADINNVYGLGGLGIMIIPGIVASTIQVFSGKTGGVKWVLTPLSVLLIALVTLIFIIVTEFLNHAELRIPIQQVMVDNQLTKSYLPIKVLLPGAMPLMFGMVVFRFPQILLNSNSSPAYVNLVKVWFSTNTIQGIMVYALVLCLLGYLFSYMNLTPHNLAEQMQRGGEYFWNVVPGEPTEHFLDQKLVRVSFVGNLYSIAIACLPFLIGIYYPAVGSFSYYFTMLYMMITILDNVIEQFSALYASSHYSLL